MNGEELFIDYGEMYWDTKVTLKSGREILRMTGPDKQERDKRLREHFFRFGATKFALSIVKQEFDLKST